MRRRGFLASSLASALISRRRTAAETAQLPNTDNTGRIPKVSSAGIMRGEMLYRDLGATGVEVSVIGMGGSHLGQAKVEEDLAIRLSHEGLDRGINFLDNSWDYNEGESERRMGKALRDGYREKVFLMTKIDGRSKKEAAKQQASDQKRSFHATFLRSQIFDSGVRTSVALRILTPA